MKRILFICWLMMLPVILWAQTGFNCQSAIAITQVSAYCSANGQYNNNNNAQNGITWFQFTATSNILSVTISGSGTGGSLVLPTGNIYADCAGTLVTSIKSTTANVTSLHAEGLTPGHTYYVAVTGQNKGTFKFCLNNYNLPPEDGEDCETAQYLDNINFDVHVKSFIGAGLKPKESLGTCLAGDESNTTWYKWKAGNDGTLVFTLTPDQVDNDIDFVVYDLGTTGDCSGVTAANAIRCAAGHGICSTGPNYSKTGLDFTSTDVSEASGCGENQDGMLRYIDMVKGHNYGLLINNFTGNAGFTISFTDQYGKPGTGTFDAPDAVITTVPEVCNVNKVYHFYNYLTTRNQFKWDFGPGSTITEADAAGNFTVVYSTPGVRNVSLTIISSLGKSSTNTVSIDVPDLQPLATPPIISTAPAYCIGDTISLKTTPVAGQTYDWTGPNGFAVTANSITVPVTDTYVNGAYTVTAHSGDCKSAANTLTPVMGIKPTAAFSASPQYNTTLYIPARATFTNTSVHADSFLWDFGDGTTSTESDPQHTYTKGGKYHVKLTATSSTGCTNATSQGDYIVLYGNVIFIPSAFTPNNDGYNDTFRASITNTKTYRIQIFNRHGSVVFESRDPMMFWDGNYNASQVPVGVYYYLINAVGLDGNAIKQSGSVTLIR